MSKSLTAEPHSPQRQRVTLIFFITSITDILLRPVMPFFSILTFPISGILGNVNRFFFSASAKLAH